MAQSSQTTSGADRAGAGTLGTRLRYGSVQDLSSVIIVVDLSRTANLNIRQLADYITMVGLAQIRSDGDTGTAPTILHLFGNTEPLPQALSPWDQSFLHTLYTTDQASVVQGNMIKSGMFEQITGR